jgi:hypothetical protein
MVVLSWNILGLVRSRNGRFLVLVILGLGWKIPGLVSPRIGYSRNGHSWIDRYRNGHSWIGRYRNGRSWIDRSRNGSSRTGTSSSAVNRLIQIEAMSKFKNLPSGHSPAIL